MRPGQSAFYRGSWVVVSSMARGCCTIRTASGVVTVKRERLKGRRRKKVRQ